MAEGAVQSSKALLPGRIEFHPSRRPGGGDFRSEALNPSYGSHRQAARPGAAGSGSASAAPRKRSDGGEFQQRGLDPELGFEITFRRIGAGLANLGNTCFLNSVLQCLTYTEPFAAYLQSGKHKSSCHTAGFCAMCALQSHVMDALRSSGKILRPFHLVKNLRCISRNFRSSRQEDAHEYMVNLLESMHKCCLPSGIASESPSAYEKSLVHKIFGGRLRSQVKCLQCSYCSNKFDPFLDLSLEIMKADTLHKALSHFTSVEQLDGGERQYQCQRCKQKVRAVKQLTIHKAPYVLTVHLKRFGSALPGQKINKTVDFEPTLDLKRYVSDPCEGDLKYTLYGVLVHAGYATHSGHYYCFVRTSSGVWYSLNDHEVFQVSEKTVLQQKAYMLFYVRNMRSYAPKRALDIACKEKRMANASGSKDMLVCSLDSKKASLDSPNESAPRKAIQDCPRENVSKQYNPIPKNETVSVSVPMPGKDITVEECLLKKTSISPCLLAKDDQKSTLCEDYSLHSLSNVSSIKEPSATVSLLSSVIGKHLVSEGLMEKDSSRDNCNQLLVEELVQSSLSKEKSVCSVSSGLVRSTSITGDLIAAKSLVEGCRVALASAESSQKKDDLTTNSTVDKSSILIMHHARGSATINPTSDNLLATNSPVEDCSVASASAQGNHMKDGLTTDSTVDVDKSNILATHHAKGNGSLNPDGRSDGLVVPKVVESISKQSGQVIPIDSNLSTSCCSSQKAGAGHTGKLVMKEKVKKHNHIRHMKFGPGRFFLAYLNQVKRNVKKKKHRRNKKQYLNIKGYKTYETLEDSTEGDQGPSTSTRVGTIDAGLVLSKKKVSCKNLRESGVAINAVVAHSTKKKYCSSLGRDNELCATGDVNINTGSMNANDSDCGKRNVKNSTETSSKLDGHCSIGETCILTKRHHVSRNLLMSSSGEVTVAWRCGIDSLRDVVSISDDEPKSIGCMLDEWEKEYDRGRKVKRSRKFFGGGNHFRDIAAVRTQKKMKVDQNSSGSRPFRIQGLKK